MRSDFMKRNGPFLFNASLMSSDVKTTKQRHERFTESGIAGDFPRRGRRTIREANVDLVCRSYQLSPFNQLILNHVN